MTFVVLVINVIVLVNMCGSDDSGAGGCVIIVVVLVICVTLSVNMYGSDDSCNGGCVSDKYDTRRKHVWQ